MLDILDITKGKLQAIIRSKVVRWKHDSSRVRGVMQAKSMTKFMDCYSKQIESWKKNKSASFSKCVVETQQNLHMRSDFVSSKNLSIHPSISGLQGCAGVCHICTGMEAEYTVYCRTILKQRQRCIHMYADGKSRVAILPRMHVFGLSDKAGERGVSSCSDGEHH